MPKPLFYFNDNLDPTLPTEIKPPLYLYDEYQTYDLIFCEGIKWQLHEQIKNYFGYNSNYLCLTAIIGWDYCLIERFTTFDITWCNDYSSKIFNFIKEFSGTNINQIVSGENHPKANLINFGNQIINQKYNADWLSVPINIPSTNIKETILISWLEFAFDNDEAPEFYKRYKILNTGTTAYDFILHFNYLQPLSLVISCENEVIKNNIENQLPECFLYKNIDNILLDLKNKIYQSFPKINKILTKISYVGEVRMSPMNSVWIVGEFDNIQEEDFSDIPEEIKASGLIYANHNYWNNLTTDFVDEINFYLYNQYLSSLRYYDAYNDFSIFHYQTYQFFNLIPDDFGSDYNNNNNNIFPYTLLWGNPAGGQTSNYPPIVNYFENINHFNYLVSYTTNSFFGSLAPYFGLLKSPLIQIKQAHVIIPPNSEDYLNDRYFKSRLLIANSAQININRTDINIGEYNVYEFSIISTSTNYQSQPIGLVWEFDNLARNYTVRQPLSNNDFINLADELHYPTELITTGENEFMPDSIRLKEIHEALNAQKFANDLDENNQQIQRFANLGYYIERIARVLGISVNPDGSVRSIRQSKFIKQGDEIPAGWSIGQWGRNQGSNTEGQKGGSEDEDRDGLAYEVRSNKFTVDKFSGEASAIEQGGYVLVENLPQLLHIILSDLDKALGWAEAGANVLPSPNSDKPVPYEGLNTLLAEVAFMLSQLSRNITGTHISSLKIQGMLMELIAHQGTSTNLKQIEVDIGIDEPAKLIYPALSGATNFEQSSLILANLSLLIGSLTNKVNTDINNQNNSGGNQIRI